MNVYYETLEDQKQQILLENTILAKKIKKLLKKTLIFPCFSN